MALKSFIRSIIRLQIVVLLLLSTTGTLLAGEGMWLPHLLKMLNEAEMQSMGMKMSAEDIYSVNRGSLKDAIVHFGGFCTGEVISANGLVLTNHHCGYGQIQSHSSVDNNLLKNGFWAASHQEELPNPGLFVTFIQSIEDLTSVAMVGVSESMSDRDRQSIIDKNIDQWRSEQSLGAFEDLIIRPFYHGNQYFAFKTITYNDVRLVGTPPENIGKFGADTDNWVWPRHTGDFSLFRIYAGPDNQPAEYAEENVPYTPKHHLPISMDGVQEGDFTLVFGFPGRTNQYLPASAIEQTIEVINPARIEVRDKALKILDSHMRANEATRIKYASKFASVANYWKKWIGENQGLQQTKAVAKKQKMEAEFAAKQDPASKNLTILPLANELYKQKAPYAHVASYYGEVMGRNIELMSIMGILNRAANTYTNNGEEAFSGYMTRVFNYLDGFYKDYEPEIDREVFTELVDLYKEKVNAIYHPEPVKLMSTKMLAKGLYETSTFVKSEKVTALKTASAVEQYKAITEDPAFKLYKQWSDLYNETIARPISGIDGQLDSLQRLYMKALMETFPDKKMYPDANSTLRVTYGQVQGYRPRDAVYYEPVTYLDGVIAKYVPGDYEFDLDQRMLDLYDAKDYGDYAAPNGQLPICFIGSNHTTGGNSGSPAIDAHGNLIGLNFDRVWEGTMSDLNYDVSICRNIMVDARYILWVIDKYAGAGHLVKEMSLVHPKK